jgi:ATP adenylyltransferase
MERLWRPWRLAYVSDIESARDDKCIFCTKPAGDDDRAELILHRGETAYIIMNLYPYNTGHVMVAPYRHVGAIEELTETEARELMDLTTLAVETIKEEMRPQGFNLGMNLGSAAGAGFAEHLHMHIVPRWHGDTNFMPVVGKSKVMPETVEGSYSRLSRTMAALLEGGS